MHSHVRDHRNTRELHRFSSSEKHSKSYPVYTRLSDGPFDAHHEFLESIKKGKILKPSVQFSDTWHSFAASTREKQDIEKMLDNVGINRPKFGGVYLDAKGEAEWVCPILDSPPVITHKGLTISSALIASYSCYGGRN